MNIETGDWVMIRKVKPLKLVHRGILLIADHTHDELLDCEGEEPVVGNAQMPYFSTVPWSERLAEAKRGEIVMAVFRWRDAYKPTFSKQRFADTVHACITLMAYLKLPYDQKAIKSHVRNYIRAFLKLRFIMKHIEGSIFCTEGCFAIFKVFGIELSDYVGIQHLVAPCHSDKLYRDGYLQLVEDYGLMKHMNPVQRKE